MMVLVEQRFFDELEERKGELGISDIQLSLTTLEEVFLNIAKQAELESAAADGTMVSLTLTTSGNTVEVSKPIIKLLPLPKPTRKKASLLGILYYTAFAIRRFSDGIQNYEITDTSRIKICGSSRDRDSRKSKWYNGRSLLGTR